MQAAGDNAQMIRALGVNVDTMIVLGLALANGLVALAGALLTQYQGFADVQMGIGMVVWGLASVIIGEALVGVRDLGFVIIGAVMGSVLFRLIVALALRGGLNPERSEAHHRGLRVRRAGAAGLPAAAASGGRRGAGVSRRCSTISNGVARRSTPARPTKCARCRASTSTIDEGSFVIVIGTNGSGKSTLLNAVAGASCSTRARITLDGADITRGPSTAARG